MILASAVVLRPSCTQMYTSDLVRLASSKSLTIIQFLLLMLVILASAVVLRSSSTQMYTSDLARLACWQSLIDCGRLHAKYTKSRNHHKSLSYIIISDFYHWDLWLIHQSKKCDCDFNVR